MKGMLELLKGERCEQNIVDLKLQVFIMLFERTLATRTYSFSNLLDFMAHCALRP